MELLEPKDAIRLLSSAVGATVAERILSTARPTPLKDLRGRLIGESIAARLPLPPMPRATVDGYAIPLTSMGGEGPLRLRVVGHQRIGSGEPIRLGEGECAYVETGALLPIGAGAVIMMEEVERRDDLVIVKGSPPVGDGIAMPASDVATGDLIIRRGTAAGPLVIAALASQGYESVTASRRPVVAIISTGEELVEPGSLPSPGKQYDINRYYIASALEPLGYEIIDGGIVSDDEIERSIEKMMPRADIIITSGSSSVGIRDSVRRALSSLGKLIVGGLRIKPGKPTVAGIVGESLFIGLPGNPRATVNVMSSFVLPLLGAIGLPSTERAEIIEATLAQRVRSDIKRRLELPLATVEGKELLAFPVAVESYMIASLHKADSKARIEAGASREILSRIVAVRLAAQDRTIVSFRDTKLIELSKYNRRVIYVPGGAVDERVVRLLQGSEALAVLPAEMCGKRLEVVSRKILLVKRGKECRTIAHYGEPPSDVRGVLIAAPRAESAAIMLEAGYTECAVLPEDYAPPGEAEELGEEIVALCEP